MMRRRSTAAGCPVPPSSASPSSWSIPVADVYGVTQFYEMFHTEPVGRRVIRVCQDGPCAVAGAAKLTEEMAARLGIRPGETTPDGAYTLEAVRCLGLCDRAPAALVNLERHAPAAAETLLDGQPLPAKLRIGGLVKIALANIAVVDPTSLEDYHAQGGMSAYRKVIREMTPEQVIAEIKASKLLGRGGAAFSAGLKWQFAVNNPPPRHIICNADESEAGAFKDRVLMDGDPFQVIEGLLIASYAIGASHAFIYVRGEHRLGYERFTNAVRQLDEAGYLCAETAGGQFTCRIEVRRGAGAYVCGEETALIESIEGKRGFPRLRPPFPANAGLWGRPTVINNVETLAKVPAIIMHGAPLVQQPGHARIGRHQALCGQRLGAAPRRLRGAVRRAAAPSDHRPGRRAPARAAGCRRSSPAARRARS